MNDFIFHNPDKVYFGKNQIQHLPEELLKHGKKVLLRCDFNVPMAKDGSGVITDDKRIRAALPTIQYLLEQGAAVIACSHMGKPKGEVKPELSLKPVAKRLSELLGQQVIMAEDVVGPDAQAKAKALQPGQIMLLENTRFEPGETKNDPALAKAMADMMANNVSATYGTKRFSGMDLCAKSGTAEVGADQKPHAWFTGFLRDEDHPYAFLVLVENGGSGSSAAGDVASRVLNALVSP